MALSDGNAVTPSRKRFPQDAELSSPNPKK